MSISIPLAKVPNDEYVKIVRRIKEQALKLAQEKYLRRYAGEGGLIIRDLKPSDLGLTGNKWIFNVSVGENKIVEKTLDDDTMIVIFQIFNLSTDPVVNEVKFGTGAGDIADVYLEDMYQYDIPAKLLEEGVIYPPGKKVVIKAIAKDANSEERLGFVGFVIEPRGKTIQPPS